MGQIFASTSYSLWSRPCGQETPGPGSSRSGVLHGREQGPAPATHSKPAPRTRGSRPRSPREWHAPGSSVRETPLSEWGGRLWGCKGTFQNPGQGLPPDAAGCKDAHTSRAVTSCAARGPCRSVRVTRLGTMQRRANRLRPRDLHPSRGRLCCPPPRRKNRPMPSNPKQ